MANQAFLYTGAILVVFWGIAHLFPTKGVVEGFGDISPDSKRIITMEWIIEGVTLIFIGLMVASVTATDYTSPVSKNVCRITFLMLNTLSIISLKTGFKINFLAKHNQNRPTPPTPALSQRKIVFPLDADRSFSTQHRGFVCQRGLTVLKSEVLWVWGPCLLIFALLRITRKLGPSSSKATSRE